MSSGAIIAVVCALCIVPLWAAGKIILFALGACRCGVLLDPYRGGGDGRKRDQCPVNPNGPRDDRGVEEPQDARAEGQKGDWWPQFERELGRYVEEQKRCPVVRPRSDGDRASLGS